MIRRLALAIGLLMTVPVVLYLWLQMDDDVFAGRARIGDIPIPPGDQRRQTLEAHAATYAQTRILLRVGPYVARGRRSTLGTALDAAWADAKLAALGHAGDPFVDLSTLWRALVSELVIPWPPEVDRHRLMDAVDRLRGELERRPVAGSFDRDGNLMDGIPGLTVDATASVRRLETALATGLRDVTLPTRILPPPKPVSFDGQDAAAMQLPFEMQTFQTKYAAGNRGRARNIELAAAALDNALILPGDTLSFNEVVGERSSSRGFQGASEIVNRRVVQGVGGGVCQVAGTLHAAAFLAGLALPTYQPHSRPTRYIPLGLDTMVAWPNRDLVVKNTYPFPVRIRARAGAGVVDVALYGAGKAHPVEWDKEVQRRMPAGESEVVDESITGGQAVVVQKPIDGMVLMRRRVIYLPSGPVEETRELRYPPTPRIVATAGN